MIVLTYERAVADLTAIVAEAGLDHVYKRPNYIRGLHNDPANPPVGGCAYFQAANYAELNDSTPPGCIIGHLLARHGLTGADLGHLNWGYGVSGIQSILKLDTRTLHFLQYVQSAQDRGQTWGEALQIGLARKTP